MTALRKVEIADAPRGPVKLDAAGNPIQNVYVRKVERNKEGELQNTVIDDPGRVAVLEVQARRNISSSRSTAATTRRARPARGARMLTRIDHVMICVPDLAKGIEAYTRLGFTVYPGGSHPAGPPTTRSRSTARTISRS